MSKHIFEEGPRRGHAAGDTSIEQQASQLASDIKYKARQKMKGASGSNLSPGQVQALYRQLLNSSSAPGAVKSIVKKKLFGEQIDRGEKFVSQILEDCKSKAFERIFEGKAEQKFVVRVTDRATGNTTYRKADRAKIAELRANKNISSVEITGRKEVDDAFKGDPKPNYGGKKAKKDYDGDGKVESGSKEHAGVVHNAIQRKKGGVADGKDTRKEETLHEDEYRRMLAKERKAEKERESKRAGVKSITPGKYASSTGRDYADSQMGFHKKVTGKTNTTEEVIYEKEDKSDKKLDVMKGKNNVKINPSIDEKMNLAKADMGDVIKDFQKSDAPQFEGKSKKERQKMAIAAKLTAERGGKKLEEQVDEKDTSPSPEEKKQLMNKDKMLKKKIMMQKQTMQMQKQGRLPLNYNEEAGAVRYCPKCDKDETRDECRYGGEYWDENSKPAKAEDEREMPTKATLFKNKLRARGIQVAGLTIAPRNMKTADELEGESMDEATRYAKETGKSFKTGKERVEGGSMKDDKAFQSVSKMIRGMQGRPEGQRPQVKGKKPPAAGEYGGPKSPAQKVATKRARKAESERMMSSRFD